MRARRTGFCEGKAVVSYMNHHIMVYQRSDLQELNELIATLPACIVVTQDPDVWFVEDESLEAALRPSSSSS